MNTHWGGVVDVTTGRIREMLQVVNDMTVGKSTRE